MTISLRQLYEQHQGKISDKWTGYLSRYETLFAAYRDLPVNLLEIGVQNGGSVEIWAKYFTKAERIVGVDINARCGGLTFDDARIQVIVSDATSSEAQNIVVGNFDIIIDDGSHYDIDIVKGFASWFKRLKVGGLYIIEDMHCCQRFAPINGICHFTEIAKELTHNRQVVPEGVYSVEFLNSLIIVRKQPSEECGLGTRFIAGQTEDVYAPVGGHKSLHGSTI